MRYLGHLEHCICFTDKKSLFDYKDLQKSSEISYNNMKTGNRSVHLTYKSKVQVRKYQGRVPSLSLLEI